MLSSQYRLKKRSLFARVEIDGDVIQSKSFGLGVYNRKDDNPTQFGFVISTKISKKAVERNRIKRIISEEIRKNITKVKNGYDIVFLIKPSVLKVNQKDLEREVDEILTKII